MFFSLTCSNKNCHDLQDYEQTVPWKPMGWIPTEIFHSTYNTRHCKDLQIPRYRTEFAKKGFHYAALTLWNDTPAEIRELPTLDRFKKQLKPHLKS